MRCRFIFAILILLYGSLHAQISDKQHIDPLVIINSAYAYPYKSATAGFVLRKLYGKAFNKWVNIDYYREDLNHDYVWSMNNAAEYMIRSNCAMLCCGRPQILNLSLHCWLNPTMDSIILDYKQPDSTELQRDPRFVLIADENDSISFSPNSDTIVLHHENPWCRAFKYLVIQHLFSIVLSDEFENKCLPQDGSQQANLAILGADKDYLHLTKKVADNLFPKLEQTEYMIKAQFIYPLFQTLWNTELDTIAGQYYNEYLKHNEK